MSIQIDTSELEALAGDLKAGAGNLGAKTAAVFRKGALDIQAAAQGLAPVDTGALKSSISTSFVGDGRFGSMAAEIGPTVEYGIYQELGTSKMPPQPFLGPAYDARIGGLTAALAALADELLR